jgi:ABC-2 type transport system permease protein
VLLPMSLAPVWMRVLAHFNPLYYAVQAARALSAGSLVSWTVISAFLVLAALSVVTVTWATRAYKTAMA